MGLDPGNGSGYDADGALVKQVAPNGVTTRFIGEHYEVQPGTGVGGQDIVTRYYLVDGQRVALRRSNDPDSSRNGRFTLHSDHLGSTSVVLNGQLQATAVMRYLPFGEHAGQLSDPSWATTDRAFTGQRWQRDIGLYHYGAPWYAPQIKRGRRLCRRLAPS